MPEAQIKQCPLRPSPNIQETPNLSINADGSTMIIFLLALTKRLTAFFSPPRRRHCRRHQKEFLEEKKIIIIDAKGAFLAKKKELFVDFFLLFGNYFTSYCIAWTVLAAISWVWPWGNLLQLGDRQYNRQHIKSVTRAKLNIN